MEPEVQRLDICELPFEDGAFGLLIANHVLEHVADDRRALCEIARVLEPGGIAILQTPFASRLSATLELPQLDDPAIRLQLYGQEDHLRLYGSDIFERFSIGGLVAINASHDNLLPECDAGKFGANRAEPLMAFRKDGAR